MLNKDVYIKIMEEINSTSFPAQLENINIIVSDFNESLQEQFPTKDPKDIIVRDIVAYSHFIDSIFDFVSEVAPKELEAEFYYISQDIIKSYNCLSHIVNCGEIHVSYKIVKNIINNCVLIFSICGSEKIKKDFCNYNDTQYKDFSKYEISNFNSNSFFNNSKSMPMKEYVLKNLDYHALNNGLEDLPGLYDMCCFIEANSVIGLRGLPILGDLVFYKDLVLSVSNLLYKTFGYMFSYLDIEKTESSLFQHMHNELINIFSKTSKQFP